MKHNLTRTETVWLALLVEHETLKKHRIIKPQPCHILNIILWVNHVWPSQTSFCHWLKGVAMFSHNFTEFLKGQTNYVNCFVQCKCTHIVTTPADPVILVLVFVLIFLLLMNYWGHAGTKYIQIFSLYENLNKDAIHSLRAVILGMKIK